MTVEWAVDQFLQFYRYPLDANDKKRDAIWEINNRRNNIEYSFDIGLADHYLAWT